MFVMNSCHPTLGSGTPSHPPFLAVAASGLKSTPKDSEDLCGGGDLQGRIDVMQPGTPRTLGTLNKKKNFKISYFCQFYRNMNICE